MILKLKDQTRAKVKIKPRLSTIILVLVSIVLAVALICSIIVIDKLSKNNLFSKSIFLDNDYFLGSMAYSSDTDDEQREYPSEYVSGDYMSGDVEGMVFYVQKKMANYIESNRGSVWDKFSIASSYNNVPTTKELLEKLDMGDYNESIRFYIDRWDELLTDNYDYLTSRVRNIYYSYGICQYSHLEVENFIKHVYDIDISIGEYAKKVIDVPYISQEGVLPNGCEAVSATMLLQYAGVDISATDFVDNYLECEPVKIKWGCRYGPNPKLFYAGDPYSEKSGYGCYAPVIVSALNKIPDRNYYAKNISGLTLSNIKEMYLDNDIPVAVWVTVHMEEVNKIIQWQSTDGGESFLYPSNEHCMVLCGYDDGNYYFNDPYDSEGLVSYPIEDCVLSYNSLGMQAVVLIENK